MSVKKVKTIIRLHFFPYKGKWGIKEEYIRDELKHRMIQEYIIWSIMSDSKTKKKKTESTYKNGKPSHKSLKTNPREFNV